MIPIHTIPLPELLIDKAESEADMVICDKCLALGITHHKDGYSVAERIASNQKIIAAIDAEIERRQDG